MTRGTATPWRAIFLDVSAVIGHRGSAAVLRRALAMARRTHAWLPDPSDDSSFNTCLEALSDLLDDRGTEELEAGRLAVQLAFRGLLASLVGAALTEQLLGAGWAVRSTQGEPVP